MDILTAVITTICSFKIEITIVLTIVYAVKWFMALHKDRPKIPGPYPWPVIGNVVEMGSQPQISLTNMAKKYGPIYLIKLGTADVLILNNYDVIKEALIRQRGVFSGRPVFESFKKISQGRGIVFNSSLTQGAAWQRMKMTIVKHLHRFIASPQTKGYVAGHVQKETVQLVHILSEKCRSSPNQAIEPVENINLAVANVVCSIMFGHRYQHGNKEFQDLISLNEQFGQVVGAGSQIDVMPWIKIFPKFRNAIKVFDFLTDRLNNWMLLRTREHRQSYKHGVIRDLVDSFIAESIDKPGQLLNDDVIMALTTDVFGAGQDTMSTTLQWIFVYMMRFKECQKKIHAELDSVLKPGSLPQIKDRARLPYLEAVMHEIFRHSTFTTTTIPHVTTEDTVLRGYHLPKETLIFINQYAANHDPEHWVEPDKFIPERFLDEKGNLISRPHDRYLLFSTGSRKCPGDELSRMLILYLMANIFTLCEISPDPNQPTTLDAVYTLSMRPKNVKTVVRVRNQDLLNKSMGELSEMTPHIQTVKSGTSSSFQTSSNEVPKSYFSEDFKHRPIVPQGQHEASLDAMGLGDINGNDIRTRAKALYSNAMYRSSIVT